MSKTASESLSAGSRQGFPLVFADMPIDTRHRSIALGLVIILLIIVTITGPFASVHLAGVDAFIPTLQTVMCVVDIITAMLLFSQYAIYPIRAVLPLASGYVFSGLFAFIQTLAFPGAYSPAGLIGDGLNTAAWLFVLWHTSFPFALIVYSLSKNADNGTKTPERSPVIVIAVVVVCTLAATAGLASMAALGTEYLPALYVNATRQTPLGSYINIMLLLFNVAAFLLLFVRRRTILDLWLTVILFVWWPNFLVAILYPTVRFSIGWYTARCFALLASSTLLFVLLAETAALYARLANAFLLLGRERADRLTSVEAATAAMAHEVRQPLTGIASRGAAGLNWLDRRPPELGKVRECLCTIVDASHRAEEIIASIRGLFKKTPSQRTIVQINDVVRAVLDLIQDDLRFEAIAATAEYQANLPEIHASHTQIQQVILNLAKNAIEAMRFAPRKRLRLVTGFDGKSGVAVYIQDSGAGIAPTDRDRIFDAFFTTKPSGTGLGLSICRTIVEEHGGTLRLSKTDSHGTSFEIILPISTKTGA